jgi:hypothetical protein
MIELKNNRLIFSFLEVHPQATFFVEFQRTLRIPDDGRTYPLPPGLGAFPLRHVDDFADNVPYHWIEHGGVMLPMYQSEALWLRFSSKGYPFVAKVAAGKINAVTGETWTNGIHRDPQDYLVIPNQPWLDGYCVSKGVIRQFVAMPLGTGYSAEEQITGRAETGGLQLVAYPMKREVYERRFEMQTRYIGRAKAAALFERCEEALSVDMGLAPGGTMRQEIYEDRFEFSDWDIRHKSRCFVHLCNSLMWWTVTGKNSPTVPPTAKEYNKHGLPWFDYYTDGETAVSGSDLLSKLKSVVTLGKEKGDVPLPENQSIDPTNIVELRKDLKKHQVREGTF